MSNESHENFYALKGMGVQRDRYRMTMYFSEEKKCSECGQNSFWTKIWLWSESSEYYYSGIQIWSHRQLSGI